jgi:DNA-binding MarR family transcriptional regulator
MGYMSTTDCNAAEIADLVLQLGRTAYADCTAGGLTQAQWIAIRFFTRANRFSRTISGFAQFHATTRGTASQTVKTLVEKGYLERTPAEKDARSIRFDLTALARQKIHHDPLIGVTNAAADLSEEERARMTTILRAMLENLGAGRGRPITGICRLCGHLDRGVDGRNARCRLMQEPLVEAEFEELCVRYCAVI